MKELPIITIMTEYRAVMGAMVAMVVVKAVAVDVDVVAAVVKVVDAAVAVVVAKVAAVAVVIGASYQGQAMLLLKACLLIFLGEMEHQKKK